MTVHAERDGQTESIDLELEVAGTPWRRLVGLLGRSGLPRGQALLIRRCGSVHTLGMRFPIDVVYLDRDGAVVKVVAGLRPWRVSAGGRRARHVLELIAGDARRLGLTPGVRVRPPE